MFKLFCDLLKQDDSFFSFFRGRQNFIQVLLKDAVRHSLSAAGYLPVLDGHLPELFYGGRELPETFFIHYPLGNGFLITLFLFIEEGKFPIHGARFAAERSEGVPGKAPGGQAQGKEKGGVNGQSLHGVR